MLGNSDSPEIQARRLDAKEVITRKQSENYSYSHSQVEQ